MQFVHCYISLVAGSLESSVVVLGSGTHKHKINLNKSIYPTIPPPSTLPPSFHQRDQILYNRVRIGHTRLTHS